MQNLQNILLKWTIASSLLLAPALPAAAQTALVAAQTQNTLYYGVPNPMAVVAQRYSCKRLLLLVSDATITRTDSCTFDLTPTAQWGKTVELSVRVFERGDTVVLSRQTFRITRLPLPEAYVGGRQSGTIPRNVLRVQDGVIANYPDLNFDGRVIVSRFTVTIQYVSGKEATASSTTGPRFTPEIKALLETISAGDAIAVTGIQAKTRDSLVRDLAPIRLWITD